MEAILSQRYSEKLVEYQRWRAVGRRLNTKLVESLDKKDIDEAGKRLGILRKGVLCFDTEDTISVLMDYAIRHVRHNGLNTVEHCLAQSPPTDREELAWLQAAVQSHYRILQVKEVYPGFGLQVCDIFRNETELLIDVGFSQTAVRHFVLGSHVYRMGDFWVTTGAALPMTPDILERLISEFHRQFGRKPEDYRTLSPKRETELAVLVIRTCLAEGMSERVSYGAAPPRPHIGQSPVTLPPSRHIGRNAPCPCGSGRKFKNCCYR